MKFTISLMALFVASACADVNVKIPTPSLPSLSLPKIPGLSALREAMTGQASAAQNVAADAAAKAKGAAAEAINLGNKLGDGAHKQLKNFGAQQSKNIGVATEGVQAGWNTIHKNVDNIYAETHNNMKRFGDMMQGLTGRLPGPAQAVWKGFQSNVDRGMDDVFSHMQRFGDMVGDNIGAVGGQAKDSWGLVRNGVDGGIDTGRNTAANINPLHGNQQLTLGGADLNSDVNGREPWRQQPWRGGFGGPGHQQPGNWEQNGGFGGSFGGPGPVLGPFDRMPGPNGQGWPQRPQNYGWDPNNGPWGQPQQRPQWNRGNQYQSRNPFAPQAQNGGRRGPQGILNAAVNAPNAEIDVDLDD